EPVDAKLIQHAQVIVGIGIPGAVDLERAGGVAAAGIAQVGRDAAVLTLEFRDRIEWSASEGGERRIQSAARNDQQRKAGPVLLKADTNRAFFVKAHGLSLAGLLSKHTRCCSHRGCRDAAGQNIAPVRIHGAASLIVVMGSIVKALSRLSAANFRPPLDGPQAHESAPMSG